MKMKPYLRPRVNGVNKLWMFTEGFGSYLSDMGEHSLRMEEFPGTARGVLLCEGAVRIIEASVARGEDLDRENAA